MPNCASETCSKKLDRRRYDPDWCSFRCWKRGQAEGRADLLRYRNENPKPFKFPRSLSDEEEVLGQPVGWKW